MTEPPRARTLLPLIGRRVDWWQVITDLQYAGYPTRRIADECVRSQRWIDHLRNDPTAPEPRLHDGLVLLGLWAKATQKAIEDAPTVD